ncbi:hypothetical protein CPC16_005681 [Podila verticillata]|nr:hypothetical protein CPC16_005681 [Podila verticillata]
MTIHPLELPHILEVIADTLRFNDLVNCVLVNHTWYNAIVRLLWEDVITYRSISTDKYNVWNYQHYFIRDQSRQGLFRNSHHIRALTCRTPRILSILSNTKCVNLVEINFVMDRSGDGFPELTRLISRNPNLRAVSVENAGSWGSEEQSQRVEAFVDVLCQFPHISCVYFDGMSDYPSNTERLCAKLLSRIKQDPRQIRRLTLQSPYDITRARRGPSQGRAWTARESPLVLPMTGKDMWRVLEDKAAGNNGRWENEQWTPIQGVYGDTVAVMETESELQIILPCSLPHAAYVALLRRFTGCHELSFTSDGFHFNEQLKRAVIAVLSQNANLRKIECEWEVFQSDPGAIPVVRNELTSLRLWATGSTNDEYLSRITPSIHLSILVDLNLGLHRITMDEFVSIMSSTPNLQTISIPSVCITGAEQKQPMIWASSSLWQVSLGLYLDGHSPDLHACYGGHWVQIAKDERDGVRSRTMDVATALASSFNEQINSQSELRELELYFNNRLHPTLSPFLDLSLDPSVGLPQLSNLKKLEKLVVTGLAHHLGQQEIQWMSQNWPRLLSIQVPILHKWVSPTEAESCTRHNFSGQAPEYHIWFEQLKVSIPTDCYSCGICRHLLCICRRFNESWYVYEQRIERDSRETLEARVESARDAAEAMAELEYETSLVDPLDDLYLGRHHQHRSGFWPKLPRQSWK